MIFALVAEIYDCCLVYHVDGNIEQSLYHHILERELADVERELSQMDG